MREECVELREDSNAMILEEDILRVGADDFDQMMNKMEKEFDDEMEKEF